MVRNNALPPVHPGEMVREDVLPEAGLSVTATAKALGVSRQAVHGILAGRRPLSAAMCLKIARLFGSTSEFWMRLQADYDLEIAARDKTHRWVHVRKVMGSGIKQPSEVQSDVPRSPGSGH